MEREFRCQNDLNGKDQCPTRWTRSWKDQRGLLLRDKQGNPRAFVLCDKCSRNLAVAILLNLSRDKQRQKEPACVPVLVTT